MDIKEKCRLTAKYIDDNLAHLADDFNKTFDLNEFLIDDINYEEEVINEFNEAYPSANAANLMYNCCGATGIKEFKRGFLTAILLRDVIL